MKLDDKDMILGERFDLEEVKHKCFGFIAQNWICTQRRHSEVEWIDFNKAENTECFAEIVGEPLIDCYSYVSFVYNRWEQFVGNKEYKLLGNELQSIEEEGVACVYTSVLMYMLMKRYDERLVKNISLIQGFYHHILRDDFPKFVPLSKHQQGVHAFLAHKSLVFDCVAVRQNNYFFDFDIDAIMGIKTKGFDLYGYKESTQTIWRYARKFANINFKSVEEWVDYHLGLMRKLC